MTTDEIPFLSQVNAWLGERAENKLYPCIRDLIENGLDLTRFEPGQFPPNRQAITHYLAAWSRHAGLTEEESTSWLMEYCVAKLAVLSRRTPAAIRHSTKGVLNYTYRSQVPFLCECTNNEFRAHCSIECPVYAEMQAKLLAKANEPPPIYPIPRPPAPVLPPYVPVKVAHRAQFETAMQLVSEEVGKGTKLARILELLEERGLKTRTGRKWTATILRSEIAKLNTAKDKP